MSNDYVEYNTNSGPQKATINYNIGDKFRQNPGRHVKCFDCKMSGTWPFRCNNGYFLIPLSNENLFIYLLIKQQGK